MVSNAILGYFNALLNRKGYISKKHIKHHANRTKSATGFCNVAKLFLVGEILFFHVCVIWDVFVFKLINVAYCILPI